MNPIGTHNYFVYILTNKNKSVCIQGSQTILNAGCMNINIRILLLFIPLHGNTIVPF